MNPTRGNLAVTNSYQNSSAAAGSGAIRRGNVIRGGKPSGIENSRPKLQRMRVRRVTAEDIGEVRRLARENARRHMAAGAFSLPPSQVPSGPKMS